MTTQVESPDGVRYQVRVRPLGKDNVIQMPRRGLSELLLGALGADPFSRGPTGHQQFLAFVEPADGGLVVGAKMLPAPGLHDALLECASMLARGGLEEFDEVQSHYGDSTSGPSSTPPE